MKKYSILLAIAALIFASLACQTLMGGGNDAPNFVPPGDGGGNESAPTFIPPGDSSGIPTEVTIPPIATDENGNITIGGAPDFPVPDDATNVINMGNELVMFQTKLSLDETMKFYRDACEKLGYVERAPDTLTTDALFIMMFDDSANGKVISIQGTSMDGSTSVNISISDK